MKLSEWFNERINCEKLNVEEYDWFNEEEKKEWIEFNEECFKFEGEDREIVLNDLKKDEGIIYLKLVEWNESETVIESGLGNSVWEGSMEDDLRFEFGETFGEESINEVLY